MLNGRPLAREGASIRLIAFGELRNCISSRSVIHTHTHTHQNKRVIRKAVLQIRPDCLLSREKEKERERIKI